MILPIVLYGNPVLRKKGRPAGPVLPMTGPHPVLRDAAVRIEGNRRLKVSVTNTDRDQDHENLEEGQRLWAHWEDNALVVLTQ